MSVKAGELRIRTQKGKIQVAQASRLCNPLKLPRETCPTGNSREKYILLPGVVKKGEILSPEERTIALQALHFWDGRKWILYASVIMPDHVHALVQPLTLLEGGGAFDLAEIIHSVKSFSVHQINQQRGRRGSIWQDERFDRIVRDEAEFLEKWQYIMNNPLKQELVHRWEDYPWLFVKND